MEGWIKLHRKLLESEIWLTKPCSWKIIWIYILSKVNHEDNNYFKRGENFFNFSQELKQIGLDIKYDTIRHFLKYVKTRSMVSTTKSTRGIVIKVNNYALYQDKDENKSTTKSTKPSTSKAQQKHNDKQELKNERNNTKVLGDKSPKKTSNPLIDYIIGKTKEIAGTPTLDGTIKQNRFIASNLIKCKIIPEFKASGIEQPTEQQLKDAIDTLFGKIQDGWWRDKIKSVSTIYYKFNNIIK